MELSIIRLLMMHMRFELKSFFSTVDFPNFDVSGSLDVSSHEAFTVYASIQELSG